MLPWHGHRIKLDRQVTGVEWLAGLATGRRIGIRQNVADRNDRLFEHERFERRGGYGETHRERTGSDAHHPAEHSAPAAAWLLELVG